MQKRNIPLQSIRFLAALLIFFHHSTFFQFDSQFSTVYARVFYYFYSAVTFFFILSGWSLAHTYYNKVKNGTFRLELYIRKRILKIYPLHLLTFFLSLPLVWDVLPTQSMNIMVTNIFLLHAFVPSYIYIYSFNAVSWSLSALLLWYALFPFFAWILSRFDTLLKKYSLPIGLFMLGLFVFWIGRNDFGENTHYVLYFSPFVRLIDCSVGVLIYFIMEGIKKTKTENRIIWTVFELISLCVLIFGYLLAPNIPAKFLWDVYFIVPWAVVIGIFSLSRGYISDFLSLKPLSILGAISFEFFLLHPLAIRWILDHVSQSIPMTAIQMELVSFGIALAGSLFVHYLLLNPFFSLFQRSPAKEEAGMRNSD